MPRVPTYDNFQVMPSQAPGQRLQATEIPDTAGSNLTLVSKGLGTLAGETAKVAGIATRAIVDDASNKVEQQVLRLAYDPKEGFTHLRGESAMKRPGDKALPDEYNEKLQKEIDRIGSEVSGGLAQQVFREKAKTLQTRFHGALVKHYGAESINFAVGTQEGVISTQINNMSMLYDNPDQLAESRLKISEAAKEVGRIKGLTSDQTAELTRNQVSKGHVAAFSAAIDADKIDYAKAYLEQFDKDLTVEARDTLRDALAKGELSTKSFEMSQQYKGLPLSKQIAIMDEKVANGEISAKVRDATVTRFEHNWQVSKSIQAEGDKSMLGEMQDWFNKNPGKTALDLPDSLYNRLKSRGHLDAASSYAKHGRYVNDSLAWAEILTLPQGELSAMTPVEFHNKYRGKLDDAHLEKGMAMVAVAKGEGKENHLSIVSNADRVKHAAVSMNILPATGKPSTSQAKSFAQFEEDIDRRIRVFEQGIKRKANSAELQKILDDVRLDRVTVPGVVFGSEQKPVATLTEGEAGRAYVSVGGRNIYLTRIPASDRANYANKLRAKGIPITQQRIAELWAADNLKSPSK